MPLSPAARLALSAATKLLLVLVVATSSALWLDELAAGNSRTFGVESANRAALPGVPSSPADRAGSGAVHLVADAHGQFTAMASINGRPAPVLVDTGASMVALSFEEARRLGIVLNPVDFTGQVRTANGIAKVAPVVLDSVGIGDITLRDVKAVVSEPGRLGTTLLGMTFIERLSRAEMRGGVLVLQR